MYWLFNINENNINIDIELLIFKQKKTIVMVLPPRYFAGIFEWKVDKSNIDVYHLIYLPYNYISIVKTIYLQIISFLQKNHIQLIVISHLNIIVNCWYYYFIIIISATFVNKISISLWSIYIYFNYPCGY